MTSHLEWTERGRALLEDYRQSWIRLAGIGRQNAPTRGALSPEERRRRENAVQRMCQANRRKGRGK